MIRRNTYLYFVYCLIISLVVLSCNSNARSTETEEVITHDDSQVVDSVAMRRLQGIWLNAESSNIVFKVEGDSIYYPDEVVLPIHYYIIGDSLFMQGEYLQKCEITKQSATVFEFVSSTGEEVFLRKSENPEDSLAFVSKKETEPVVVRDVTMRDTVVTVDGSRLHCYVYVTPTHKKIYKTSMNEEGIEVQNYYYDNIINISVFKGKSKLFSRDFNKLDFKESVPVEFLTQSTLNDVNFSHVDEEGLHFETIICIPDDALCYMTEVLVRMNGSYELKLMDY